MFRKTPLHIGSEEILSLPRDFSHLNYEVALFSDTDVYAGQDSHGTIKLFKFLRSIGINCCLLLTGEKHLELDHSYYVGHIAHSSILSSIRRAGSFDRGINQTLMFLALQIFGEDFYEKEDAKKQSKIINEYEMSFEEDDITDVRRVRIYEEEFELMSSRDENKKQNLNAQLVSVPGIKLTSAPGVEAFEGANKDLMTFYYKYSLLGTPRLPNFKKVIFCSRDEAYATDVFNFNLLQNFKNNPICFYYGMVNDTYTAFCAYPKSQGCEKFKFFLGCYNCKALESHNKTASEKDYVSGLYIPSKFNQLRQIYCIWDQNIRYLGASNFSLKQARESYLFKDIKQSKALLPIDSLPDVSFEALHGSKLAFKNQALGNFFNHYNSRTAEENFTLLNSTGEDIHEFYKKGKNPFIFGWSAMVPTVKRKGFESYIDIIWELYANLLKNDNEKNINDFLFLFLGEPEEYHRNMSRMPPGFNAIMCGKLPVEEALKYLGACDVYCCTTLEDAGPRTVSESLGIGTPVISYEDCIASDLIDEECGWIVETGNVKKYSQAMFDALDLYHNSPDKLKQMSKNSYDSYHKNYSMENLSKQWFKALEMDYK